MRYGGWTALDGVDGVFWREVGAVTADTFFEVLKGNKVTVQNTVTKAMLQGVKEGTKRPTLAFTAYAVQKEGITTAADAWAKRGV